MTNPSTMKAAAIDRFGPPSAIRVHRQPVPAPGPERQKRIDVWRAEASAEG